MSKNDNGNASIALTETEKLTAEEIFKEWDQMTDIESGPGSISVGQKLGVYQRIITAVSEDKDYLQILLLAAFDNKQEAMLAADAIEERQRYGVSIRPILTRVVAQCAIHADRVDRVLRAMTTYSLNSNYKNNAPYWKKKQEDKGISLS